MARHFRTDPEGFESRRSKAGQVFFHGPQDSEDFDAPAWVYDLLETVAGSMESLSGPNPVGFMYREESGLGDIAVYPKSVEMVGGPEDGEILAPGFSLDLEGLRAEFTQHIPPKGAHLIRYYGWYSNKSREMRCKVAEAAEQAGSSGSGD